MVPCGRLIWLLTSFLANTEHFLLYQQLHCTNSSLSYVVLFPSFTVNQHIHFLCLFQFYLTFLMLFLQPGIAGLQQSLTHMPSFCVTGFHALQDSSRLDQVHKENFWRWSDEVFTGQMSFLSPSSIKVLTDRQSQSFTSHSTQNRSFRRRSFQPISWYSTEETKCNTTKSNNTRTS